MNVQFDLNNIYMYKNQDWMSSKGYFRNSYVPKMWEKLKFSTSVFFKLWLLFFLSLMITPVRYVCDVFILITQTDLPLTSRISRALSSCVYLRDCELSHRSVGTSVHFLFCQFFMCSDVQYIDSYLDKLFYTSL